MATFIVLLGPPGAGKGTQAKRISGILGLPHVSTGDLFRENLADHTALGVEAGEYINKGQLVPDSLTIAMVEERLTRSDCAPGALLDGFPRTLAQAEAFDEMLEKSFNSKVFCVPCIEVDPDLLVERLSDRLVCRNGHVFHLRFSPPKKAGVCDLCGEPLYQREDDKAETVTKRIEVYNVQTAPLIQYYEDRRLLRKINGDQDIEAVTQDILSVLNEANAVNLTGTKIAQKGNGIE